jgi:hypothetical protein
MSKTKALGILAAMLLCGVILLSTLAVAAGDPYFSVLQGPFLRGCAEQAGLRSGEQAKAFMEACRFVVHALRGLTPFNITAEEFQDALVDEILSRTPGNCDKCIQVIGDLEAALATNQTAQNIDDALVAGCERRFSDPAEADQCRQIVGDLLTPQTIDFVLANFPPLTACRAANSCPLQ